MATEILSPGESSTIIAHTSAVVSKTFYLINSRVVLALDSANANEDNVFVYAADKVQVPKATGQAWAIGTAVYWDDTNKNFTTTATGNTLAGMIVEVAASADAEGIIHLTPFA